MTFTTTIEATGGNTTGIRVADSTVEELGEGKRARVVVTLDGGYTFRTTLGRVDGAAFVPVSAAVREEAGVAAGDVVEVGLAVDTEPRTVEVPDDLAAALAGDDEAASWFATLTDSQRKGFVTSVTSAKQPETRLRRVARAVEALAAHEQLAGPVSESAIADMEDGLSWPGVGTVIALMAAVDHKLMLSWEPIEGADGT